MYKGKTLTTTNTYQKAISQLSTYLHIPCVNDTVRRAISNLKAQEAEELQLEMDVSRLYGKLMAKDGKGTIGSKIKLMEYIVNEFLIINGFLSVAPNMYALDGYDIPYVFEVIYISDDSVFLKRQKTKNRPSKSASFVFDRLPSLKSSEEKKDKAILKQILNGLKVDLKRTWDRLNFKKTSSTPSTVTEEDELESMETFLSTLFDS